MNNILCTKCAFDVLGEHCGLAGFTNQYPRTSCSAYNNIAPTGFVLGNDGYFHWVKNKDPMYRPFANADECWNEMLKHQPFGWINNLNAKRLYNIKTFDPCDDMRSIYILDGWKSLSELFSDYTFADGAAFGVKVEEK